MPIYSSYKKAIEGLEKNKDIKEVTISLSQDYMRNTKVSTDEIRKFTSLLSASSVSTLTISSNIVEQKRLPALGFSSPSQVQFLSGGPNSLEETDYTYQHINGIKEIMKSLPESSISSLNLTGLNFTSDLLEILPKSKITHLDLSNNDIGDKDLKIIQQSLIGSSVKNLNLSDNDISDEGATSLALMLHGTNVDALNLFNNEIGDAGAVYVVGLLGNKLVDLNMSFNRITNKGIDDIEKFAPYVTELGNFDYSTQKKNPSGVPPFYNVELLTSEKLDEKLKSNLALSQTLHKIHAPLVSKVHAVLDYVSAGIIDQPNSLIESKDNDTLSVGELKHNLQEVNNEIIRLDKQYSSIRDATNTTVQNEAAVFNIAINSNIGSNLPENALKERDKRLSTLRQAYEQFKKENKGSVEENLDTLMNSVEKALTIQLKEEHQQSFTPVLEELQAKVTRVENNVENKLSRRSHSISLDENSENHRSLSEKDSKALEDISASVNRSSIATRTLSSNRQAPRSSNNTNKGPRIG